MPFTTLGPKTAKGFLAKTHGQPVVVLFYMNGCPHCEMMHGDWMAAVHALRGRPGMHMAQIEYNAMPDAMRDMIAGFPTIATITNGAFGTEYAGDRSAESIKSFVVAECSKGAAKKPAPKAKPAAATPPVKKRAPRKKPAA